MEVHSSAMKKVRSTSQIKLKTSSQGTRGGKPMTGKVTRTISTSSKPWYSGKTQGTGLDDYNLDLMKLL